MKLKLMGLMVLSIVAFAAMADVAKVGDYVYHFSITSNNCVEIVNEQLLKRVEKGEMIFATAVSPCPTGCYEIPSKINGLQVSKIGAFAFSGCSNVTSVVIPDTVVWIGDYAFGACLKLREIKFPNMLRGIGMGAFIADRSLMISALPSRLESIGEYAFYKCASITSITIPVSLASGKKMRGNFLGRDDAYVFNGMTNLRSVVLEEGWKEVPRYMFKGCSNLTSVLLPKGITCIEKAAFYGCNSLETLALPETLKVIDKEAFANCKALQSIEVPKSVEYLDARAFRAVPCVQSMENGMMVKDGWLLGWGGSERRTIELPLKAKHKLATHSLAMSTAPLEIVVRKDEPTTDDFLFIEMFEDARSLVSLKIEKHIKDCPAFRGCTELRKIELPDSISRLNDEAFRDCASLEDIVMPKDCFSYALYHLHSNVSARVSQKIAHDKRDTSWASFELYVHRFYIDDMLEDSDGAHRVFTAKMAAAKRFIKKHPDRYTREVDKVINGAMGNIRATVSFLCSACKKGQFSMFGAGDPFGLDAKMQRKWDALSSEERVRLACHADDCMYELCRCFFDAYDEPWAGKWLLGNALLKGEKIKKVDLYKRMARHAARYLLWRAEAGAKDEVEIARSAMLDYVQEIMDLGFPEQAQMLQVELDGMIKERDPVSRKKPRIITGTGWFVNAFNVATCWHVVQNAKTVSIEQKDGQRFTAKVVASDPANDIAILKGDGVKCSSILPIRTKGVKIADKVFTIGYPLSSLLGQTQKYSEGVVNSITGLSNDSRYYQISVPIQPGNSGGPLADEKGCVIGLTSAALDALKLAVTTGTIPQNVNYAIKVRYLAAILDDAGIDYATATADKGTGSAVERVANATVLVVAE